MLNKGLKENIVGAKRLGDGLITIKLVFEEDIIYSISACVPHVGLDESAWR